VFAGYIAYLSKEGVVSGYSDGTFRPADPLSGYAFMKMLLGALGYDAKIEGYVGANWSVSVAKRATNIGLADGNDDFVGTKAVTREEAALYAFNTLKATVVDYDNNSTVVIGDVTISNQSTAKAVERVESASTNYTGSTTDSNYGTLQFCEQNFPKLKLTVTTDAFKRAADKWTYKNDTVGTYAEAADKTYTGKVSKGTLYDLIGKDTYDALADSGNTDAKLSVYVDGYTVVNAQTDGSNIATYFVKDSSAAAGTSTGETGPSVTTEVFLKDDNCVDIVIINTWVLQAAADYSVKNETLTLTEPTNATKPGTYASKTLSADDFNVAGYKEDDYVVVTAAYDGSNYTIKSVAPATLVSGEVNSFAKSSNVTLDGTNYSYNKRIAANATDGKDVVYSVGKNAKLVLDTFGNVIYVDEVVSASDSWVYINEVAKANGLGSKFVADATFVDGTEAEIQISQWTTNSGTTYTTDATNGLQSGASTSGIEKGWYTYVLSNGKYKLTEVSAQGKSEDSASGGKIFETGKTKLGDDATEKLNQNTVVIVKDADDVVTVYKGIANIPTITAKSGETLTAYYVKNANTSFVDYLYVDVGAVADIEDTSASTTDYVYLLKQNSNNYTSDNKNYKTYDAIVDGEKTTINVSADCSNQDLNTLYYNGKVDSNGWYTSLTAASSKSNVDTQVVYDIAGTTANDINSFKVSYDGGVLAFAGKKYASGAEDTAWDGEEFVLANNAKIYLTTKATALMTDTGANYELTEVSATELVNLMYGLKATKGNYSVVRTSSDDDTVAAIYLYIETTDSCAY
jgi:hypothetical protein